MLKDTKSLGNNKAPACESRGFVRKKRRCAFWHTFEKAKKGDKAEQKKWEQNEQNAMMLENIIRQVLGDEKRKTYFYQQEEKQEEK